uniref:Uncharacterized protein n=1 Tax=Rhizophora mucronata TaxID=61149 RepID=A0A2P2N4N0_RHIMU
MDNFDEGSKKKKLVQLVACKSHQWYKYWGI